MRAKEFPRLVFDTIHRAVGEPPIEKWPNRNIDYFGFSGNYGKVFAHLGWQSYNNGRYGDGAKIGIWGYTMRELMTNEDEIVLLDPILEIRGGIEDVGEWVIGRGNLLRERVGLYWSSNYYGWDVQSPVTKLISEVIGISHALAHEAPVMNLSYWEAFRNPNRDYREPDR